MLPQIQYFLGYCSWDILKIKLNNVNKSALGLNDKVSKLAHFLT